MDIDPKIIIWGSLIGITILILAIAYTAVVGPFGDITRVRPYNLEVMTGLSAPLGLLIGLLMGLISKKS